ncbi:unnamed protein product [Mytilus edulis]|uniref:WSC domain-containing protein n=1 Tax=Mytilus edulis TaxID=6550 RepID=A0A8S3S9Q2_MYTED|nr:unnamed protein product [Mytilus edulis]
MKGLRFGCTGTLYFIHESRSWNKASDYCTHVLTGNLLLYGPELLNFITSCSIQNTKIWLGKPWPEYLGCKEDKLALSIKSKIDNNQMVECLEFCRVYSLFGVQGKTCMCFSSTTTFNSNTECSNVCQGNSAETCGGFRSMDTYRVVNSMSGGNCQSLHYSSSVYYALRPDGCDTSLSFICKVPTEGTNNVCNHKTQYQVTTVQEQTTHSTTDITVSEKTGATTSESNQIITKYTESEETTEPVTTTQHNVISSVIPTILSTIKQVTTTGDKAATFSNQLTTEEDNGNTLEATTFSQLLTTDPLQMKIASLDWLMFTILGFVGTVLIIFVVSFCVIKKNRKAKHVPEEKDFEIVEVSEYDRYSADMVAQEQRIKRERKDRKSLARRLSTEMKKMSRNLSFTRYDVTKREDSNDGLTSASSSSNKRNIKGRQNISTPEFASVSFRHRPMENQPFENLRFMSQHYGAGHSIKSLFDKAETSQGNNPRTLQRISTFKPNSDEQVLEKSNFKPIVTIRKLE